MKIIMVIFSIVGVSVVGAHESETIDSRDVESDGNNSRDDSFEEPQLTYVQSVLSQLNGDNQAKVDVLRTDNDKGDQASEGSESINDGDLKEEDITDATSESSISSESDSTYEVSKEVGRSILDYLTHMLKENKNSNANRRLDIEDNGDDFAELVDIDDPRSNDYNQDTIVNLKSNRAFSNYGARLDMKGRSGTPGGLGEKNPSDLVKNIDPESQANINKDRSLFRPVKSRQGLFMNSRFYQFGTPPSVTFSKIDNHDILRPMNRLNRFPYRRIQNQWTTEKVVLDENANAYQYEPEGTGLETQIKSWNYGKYK